MIKAMMGQCEVCDKNDIPVTLHYGKMAFCDECWAKEESAQQEINKPENQQARIDATNNRMNEALAHAKRIDEAISVRTDLFNAATVAIVDICATIDNDPTIENKPYKKAEVLKERFEHYKNVVFELNQQIAEAGNHQKAIQVYLNNLANTLRTEEREKLKIQDINYKPTPPKVSKPKTIGVTGTKKVKMDKVALRNAAANLTKELGQPVPEFMIQQYVVSRNMSVEQASDAIRKFVKEARSASN